MGFCGETGSAISARDDRSAFWLGATFLDDQVSQKGNTGENQTQDSMQSPACSIIRKTAGIYEPLRSVVELAVANAIRLQAQQRPRMNLGARLKKALVRRGLRQGWW